MQSVFNYFGYGTNSEWKQFQLEGEKQQNVTTSYANIILSDEDMIISDEDIKDKININHTILPEKEKVRVKTVRFDLSNNKSKTYKWTKEQKNERKRQVRQLVINSRTADYREDEREQQELDRFYQNHSVEKIAEMLAMNHCLKNNNGYHPVLIKRFMKQAQNLKEESEL